jgi:transglutaminase-like putative cysteine protease
MIYKIVHRTTYKYKYPVSVGNHVACLKPRSLPRHQLEQSELHIQPTPATMTERVDYFGNILYFFTVQEPHTELVVEARSEVMMEDSDSIAAPEALAPLGRSGSMLPEDHSPEGLEAYQFRFESPRIPLRPEFAAYALQSFTPGGRCERAFWI